MIFTFLSSISGGFFYFILRQIYLIKILKTRFTPDKLYSLNQLINIGLFLGAIIGFIRDYSGIPVIELISNYKFN